jgi:hypothetical protein
LAQPSNSSITIIPAPKPVAPTNPALSQAAGSNLPPRSVPPAAQPLAKTSAETATAVGAPAAFFSRRIFWMATLVVIAGFAVVWRLFRRSRATSQPSLITRSLEREQNRRQG